VAVGPCARLTPRVGCVGFAGEEHPRAVFSMATAMQATGAGIQWTFDFWSAPVVGCASRARRGGAGGWMRPLTVVAVGTRMADVVLPFTYGCLAAPDCLLNLLMVRGLRPPYAFSRGRSPIRWRHMGPVCVRRGAPHRAPGADIGGRAVPVADGPVHGRSLRRGSRPSYAGSLPRGPRVSGCAAPTQASVRARPRSCLRG
jgi:hypothetical protein